MSTVTLPAQDRAIEKPATVRHWKSRAKKFLEMIGRAHSGHPYSTT